MSVRRVEANANQDLVSKIVTSICSEFSIDLTSRTQLEKFNGELRRNVTMFTQSKDFIRAEQSDPDAAIDSTVRTAIDFLKGNYTSLIKSDVFKNKSFRSHSLDLSTIQSSLRGGVKNIREIPMDFNNTESLQQANQSAVLIVQDVTRRNNEFVKFNSTLKNLNRSLIESAQHKDELAMTMIETTQANQIDHGSTIQLNNTYSACKNVMYPSNSGFQQSQPNNAVKALPYYPTYQQGKF